MTRPPRLLPVTIILVSIMTLMHGCYSFRSFGIDPSLESFFVDQFEVQAFAAPPNINQTFSERLKLKIYRESRLVLDEANPDIVFDGAITRYEVLSVSPEPGEFAALQRLEITVRVKYENTRDEKGNWEQSFSFFADFSPDQNLLDVQDQLIDIIFDQILEDIFNKAFGNW